MLLFLIFWIWGIGGGLVYCFSPGQKIEIETPFTGCQCDTSCIQIEESPSLSKTLRPNVKPSFEVIVSESHRESPGAADLFFTRLYEPLSRFAPPNPLLYVKLLF